jgi:ParB family chromosome partitioning protein
MAQRIVDLDMNVREVEAATRRPATGKGAGRAAQQPGKDADTLALEKAVSDALGLAVDIRHKGAKGGEIRIAYRTLEQLDTICRQLRARLQ